MLDAAGGLSSLLIPDSIRDLIHLSSVLGWTLAAGFAVFWVVMLIDCLRRPAFYPVLGTTWRTRVFWLLTFLLLHPLATLMYLMFGRMLPPRPKAQPPVSAVVIGLVLLVVIGRCWPSRTLSPHVLRFLRDSASGEMRLEEGGLASGVSLSAARRESESSLTATSSSAGNDESLFMCERVVVLGSSKHPLMQKVAGVLCQRLGALPFIKAIAYYPPGKLPPIGGQAPDMVLMLDAPRLNQGGLAGYRELDCAIEVSAGQIPWSSDRHVFDARTPPVFSVAYHLRLEHHSRLTGVETSEARYQKAADDIVEQIAGNLLKALVEWSGKHGGAGELPASLYGDYVPSEEALFAAQAGWELVLSGAGLFEHNRTVWRIRDARPPVEVLADLKTQLTSLGWRCDKTEDNSDSRPFLQMSKSPQHLQVFQPRAQGSNAPGGTPESPQPIIAVYRLGFTADEQCRAMEDLLEVQASAEQLLRFRSNAACCPNGLSNRFSERIAAAPATSARGLISAVHWFHERGEDETARARLRGAVALAWADGCKSELDQEFKELGSKLGMADVAQSRPSEQDLVDVGIPAMPLDGKEIERDMAMGESLRAWYVDSTGDLCMVRSALLPGEKKDEPFRLSLAIAHDGSNVTSTAGLSRTRTDNEPGPWLGCNSVSTNGVRVGATATSQDGRRFRLAVKMLDEVKAQTASRPMP